MMRFTDLIYGKNKVIINKINLSELDLGSKTAIINTLSKTPIECNDILIIGDGSVGNKASEFINYTQLIQDVGLYTTKKILCGSDIVSSIYQSTTTLEVVSKGIANYFKNYPVLLVRSSGQGDAGGVGIYESKIVPNEENYIADAIYIIKKSNHCASAIAYRKRLSIDTDDFGIIIEPCVGDTHINGSFGPQLSGRGRFQQGSIEIGVTGGISGGVYDSEYVYILKEKKQKFTLEQIIIEMLKENNQLIEDRYSPNLLNQWNEKIFNSFAAYKHPKDSRYSKELFSMELIINYQFSDIQKIWDTTDTTYIEFATQKNNSLSLLNTKTLNTYITQISKSVNQLITQNLHINKKSLLDLKEIVHTGEKKINTIVYINGELGEFGRKEILLEINRQYNNYLLCISHKSIGFGQNLSFEYYSQAGGIILFDSKGYMGINPPGHFKGLMDATDILFSMTKNDISIINSWGFKKQDYNWSISLYTGNEITLVQDQKTKLGKIFH